MDTSRKVFAFRLAEKQSQSSKWRARDGVSVAGCTHIGGGIYWEGPIWNRDGQYEC